jgi:uncharacterized protein (DUF433 family)
MGRCVVDSLEVAQSAEPAPQLHVARLCGLARPLPGAAATHSRAVPSPDPIRGLSILRSDAEASTSEEPGAGIRHAGICAGTVWETGRSTAMPSYDTSEEWYDSSMIDWSSCPAVERDPGRVSGAWVFRGTRVPVSALFENLEDGASASQFVEWFPGVALEQVRTVLDHAARSALAPASSA